MKVTRRDVLKSGALAATPLLAQTAPTLPNTEPLTRDGDLSEKMMDGAHTFVERKISQAPAARAAFWRRDPSTPAAYEKSIEANRKRLAHLTGVVDPRESAAMERYSTGATLAFVDESPTHRVSQVRWPVLDGVSGEGLLFEPTAPSQASLVLLPDADQTPEQLGTLAGNLARQGFQVLAPTLIDRTSRWSGHPEIRKTDQSHREWIYRQSFHMGRHIIGYEIQKVLAAVDWFQHQGAHKIAAAGFGEGGLIAFYAAALDPRISAVLVSGYFDSRQAVWSEPIYRNVWGLLREFGDAEIATLIAPRALVVEYGPFPSAANQKGDLRTPTFQSVSAEFDRISTLIPAGFQKRKLVREAGPQALAEMLDIPWQTAGAPPTFTDHRTSFDPAGRQHRQVKELERHVQTLVRGSEQVREKFFLNKIAPELADESWSTRLRDKTIPPQKIADASKPFREYLHNEILGRFDEPLLPFHARTRQIYDQPGFLGYEVVLDVFPDLFAWGILLIPKAIKSGERRPVVVCQHGRAGLPREVVEGDTGYYHDFAARLANEGFITFAPHNLYRGEDRYRWLSRKANGIRASLFSFIIAQHDQILRWLATLPMVDPARIAFYGLSYGGETAVRVPAVLTNYALSICSGDFNSWTEKVAATDLRFGFMYTIEWEMPYFNMGSTFDYAELAYLILPRPFMVERGHNDHVSKDQLVAREYAKVRWLYAQVGLEQQTEIEYFNGGHTINAQGTFQFLRRHLNWPAATKP